MRRLIGWLLLGIGYGLGCTGHRITHWAAWCLDQPYLPEDCPTCVEDNRAEL